MPERPGIWLLFRALRHGAASPGADREVQNLRKGASRGPFETNGRSGRHSCFLLTHLGKSGGCLPDVLREIGHLLHLAYLDHFTA